MTKTLQTFNIIRQRGEPNEVTTIWGWKAFRQEKLFAPDPYNTLIPCLHYDNHFLYEIPLELSMKNPKLYGDKIPSFVCTCGGVAGVVGPGAYLHDASISDFKNVNVVVTPENLRVVKITKGFVFACLLRNCVVDPKTQEFWGKHADNST